MLNFISAISILWNHMRNRRILLCIKIFALCLLIGIAWGQDWLEGGYVSSVRSNDDPGLAGMLQWLDTPVPTFSWYRTGGSFYPGPYGVYPFNPLPYYSDFRLNSLAGMNWVPFQKNWSETMDYAKTKSSFNVYPVSRSAYPSVQFPPFNRGWYSRNNSISRHERLSGLLGWELHWNWGNWWRCSRRKLQLQCHWKSEPWSEGLWWAIQLPKNYILPERCPEDNLRWARNGGLRLDCPLFLLRVNRHERMQELDACSAGLPSALTISLGSPFGSLLKCSAVQSLLSCSIFCGLLFPSFKETMLDKKIKENFSVFEIQI